MKNLTGGDSIFSVTTSSGFTYNIIVDQYISATTFVEYWNTVSQTLKIESLSAPSYEFRHRFKFSINTVQQACILSGAGWNRLGFNIDGISRINHLASRIYDYVGPKMIHIAINGLHRQMNHGNSTYQIPITAAFGSTINFQNYDHQQVQTYISDSEFEISQLIISLYDEYDRPIESVNDQQLNFCMTMTLHKHE